MPATATHWQSFFARWQVGQRSELELLRFKLLLLFKGMVPPCYCRITEQHRGLLQAA
jgi:hypothetical protein